MDPATENDLPLDFFVILRTRKIIKGLAALGTASFCLRQLMDLFHAGKILMAFSAMTCGSWLLTTFAWIGRW